MHEGKGPDQLRSLCVSRCERRKNFLIGSYATLGGGGPWPPQSFKGFYSTVSIAIQDITEHAKEMRVIRNKQDRQPIS